MRNSVPKSDHETFVTITESRSKQVLKNTREKTKYVFCEKDCDLWTKWTNSIIWTLKPKLSLSDESRILLAIWRILSGIQNGQEETEEKLWGVWLFRWRKSVASDHQIFRGGSREESKSKFRVLERHIRQYYSVSLAGTKKVKRDVKVPERGRF